MGEWFDKHLQGKVHVGPERGKGVFHITTDGVPKRRGDAVHGPSVGVESLDAKSRGTANPHDVNAYETTKALPLSEAERQYLLAVARGEGYYGLGWTAGAGQGSHNWGAVQGTGDAGSFPHLDHHADGTPYTAPFKAYSSDAAGAGDMARILIKPNVKAALAKGSLRQAVYAQHSNGYFELDPEKYLSAVMKNYNTLANSVFPKRLLSEKGGPKGGVLGQVAIAGGVLAGGTWAVNKIKAMRKGRIA